MGGREGTRVRRTSTGRSVHRSISVRVSMSACTLVVSMCDLCDKRMSKASRG